MSLKFVYGIPGEEFLVLKVGHSLSRWVSLSIVLHVLQVVFNVPLKLLPHSSIPNLAIIIVFVSCLVEVKSSFCAARVYVGLSIFSRICAVFVLGVRTLLTVL